MIKVTIYKEHNDFVRITTNGHAEFDEYGRDIVCSGVSSIVINTINSLDNLTDATLNVESDDDKGFIDCVIYNPDHDSNLLMKSLVLGLEGIRDSYSKKYLQIIIREV